MADPVTAAITAGAQVIGLVANVAGGINQSNQETEDAIFRNQLEISGLQKEFENLYGTSGTKAQELESALTYQTTTYEAQKAAEEAVFTAQSKYELANLTSTKKGLWGQAQLGMESQAKESKYAAGQATQSAALSYGQAVAGAGYSGARGTSPLLALQQQKNILEEQVSEQIRRGNEALTSIGSRASQEASLLTENYLAKSTERQSLYEAQMAQNEINYNAIMERARREYDIGRTAAEQATQLQIEQINQLNYRMNPTLDPAQAQAIAERNAQLTAQRKAAQDKAYKERIKKSEETRAKWAAERKKKAAEEKRRIEAGKVVGVRRQGGYIPL